MKSSRFRVINSFRSTDDVEHNQACDETALIHHKQRLKRISNSARKEKSENQDKTKRASKIKATKPSRTSALSKRQVPQVKKKKKSGSRQKGSTSHSKTRKTRHSSGYKPVPLKTEIKSLPPKSGLNTSKHKSQASRQLPQPAIPQSENKQKKPLNVLNEILKESTDSKFLEVIDNLRELRKKNSTSTGHSTLSNRVF